MNYLVLITYIYMYFKRNNCLINEKKELSRYVLMDRPGFIIKYFVGLPNWNYIKL